MEPPHDPIPLSMSHRIHVWYVYNTYIYHQNQNQLDGGNYTIHGF